MQFYPEETDDSMSEVWHGSRWREYPLDQLTPSYSKEGKRFYVNELARLKDGRLVIPYIWIMYKGKLHMRCRQAYNTNVRKIPSTRFLLTSTKRRQQAGFIVLESEMRISVEDLDLNYVDLLQLNIPLTFQGKHSHD